MSSMLTEDQHGLQLQSLDSHHIGKPLVTNSRTAIHHYENDRGECFIQNTNHCTLQWENPEHIK